MVFGCLTFALLRTGRARVVLTPLVLDTFFDLTRGGGRARLDFCAPRSEAERCVARLGLVGFFALALANFFWRLPWRNEGLDLGGFFFLVGRFADIFAATDGLRALALVFDDFGKCLSAFPDDFTERLAGFLVFFLADFLVKAEIRDARSRPVRGGWTINRGGCIPLDFRADKLAGSNGSRQGQNNNAAQVLSLLFELTDLTT